MVRLRLIKGIDYRYVYRFQFQYGAIKTDKLVNAYPLFDCFNSNMVRLRQAALRHLHRQVQSFNSNMVRLRL